jgi:hypothetical protein
MVCQAKFELNTPHRYRHINQFIDVFETEGEEGKDVKERVSRKEAVHRVLDIIKKLGLQWQRKTQPLSGWRDSL